MILFLVRAKSVGMKEWNEERKMELIELFQNIECKCCDGYSV